MDGTPQGPRREDLKNQLPDIITLQARRDRRGSPPAGTAPGVGHHSVDYAPLGQVREGGGWVAEGGEPLLHHPIRRKLGLKSVEFQWLALKMQTSTASPESNTTSTSNITKSKEQILIQSSGAMIAVIVIGIIIILTVVLFVLKTYNKRTHASRLLGSTGGSKPRKKASPSTVPTMPMDTIGVSSVSGSLPNSNPTSETSLHLPMAQLSSARGNHIGLFSTNGGSTVVTIHDTSGNT
uniref:noncompact myelin-associated protein n=1 Tax=Doryrhamphus excisus TaxID=161450 RepID=UPI0025ADAB20|nr:noncompact myelin-associated protein [Doryrhamphus excisus]